MSEQEQWVITCVAEGPNNPFDLVSEFLETLRVAGNYDIVATSISPATGISPKGNKCGDNDNYDSATPVASSSCNDDIDNGACVVCGASHANRIYADIIGASIDGHDASVYAGRNG